MTDPMREAFEAELEQAYWDFKNDKNPHGLSERDRFKMAMRGFTKKHGVQAALTQPRMTEEEAVNVVYEVLKDYPRVNCQHKTINEPDKCYSNGLLEVLGEELVREAAEFAARALLAKLPVQNNQPHDNKEADSQINLSEDDLLKIVSDYVKKEPLAEGVNAFHVKVIYNALINSAKKE